MVAAEGTYNATGFPAPLIILGVLGLIVCLGILIAGRRGLAGRVAAGSALLIVVGVVIENVS
jgi:hypothetical protein